ncbi:MAG: transcriptional regulator [Phycisphaerales bacterium]|nr:transcriptional regulator [Phycisphaerales bacterium]
MGRQQTTARSSARGAFPKVRREHAREAAEDYVEAIEQIRLRLGACRVADLARLMQVSHVTVVKTLCRLAAEGLVRKTPYGPVELTRSGASLARTARLRHDDVVGFLRAIGVPEPHASLDAEGMEHHLSSITVAAMRRFLRARGRTRT